jgi:hypothetical protein
MKKKDADSDDANAQEQSSLTQLTTLSTFHLAPLTLLLLGIEAPSCVEVVLLLDRGFAFKTESSSNRQKIKPTEPYRGAQPRKARPKEANEAR